MATKSKILMQDITRSVHASGQVRLARGFLAYAHERIGEIAALDEIPEIEEPDFEESGLRRSTLDDYYRRRDERSAERNLRYGAAFQEIAEALNIRYAVLNQGRGSRDELSDEEHARFEEWEKASRRLQPMRGVLAVIRELPDDGCETINEQWEQLDDVTRAELRPAVDEYLHAADLAQEMRRLLASSVAKAQAIYERRVSTEPLVAPAPVAETDRPTAKRPLIDVLEIAMKGAA